MQDSGSKGSCVVGRPERPHASGSLVPAPADLSPNPLPHDTCTNKDVRVPCDCRAPRRASAGESGGRVRLPGPGGGQPRLQAVQPGQPAGASAELPGTHVLQGRQQRHQPGESPAAARTLSTASLTAALRWEGIRYGIEEAWKLTARACLFADCVKCYYVRVYALARQLSFLISAVFLALSLMNTCTLSSFHV